MKEEIKKLLDKIIHNGINEPNLYKEFKQKAINKEIFCDGVELIKYIVRQKTLESCDPELLWDLLEHYKNIMLVFDRCIISDLQPITKLIEDGLQNFNPIFYVVSLILTANELAVPDLNTISEMHRECLQIIRLNKKPASHMQYVNLCLGLIYIYGFESIQKDIEKGMQYLKIAQDNGCRLAAVLYYSELGFAAAMTDPKSPIVSEAIKQLTELASENSLFINRNLIRLLIVSENKMHHSKQIISLYIKSAYLGDLFALKNLYFIYVNGYADVKSLKLIYDVFFHLAEIYSWNFAVNYFSAMPLNRKPCLSSGLAINDALVPAFEVEGKQGSSLTVDNRFLNCCGTTSMLEASPVALWEIGKLLRKHNVIKVVIDNVRLLDFALLRMYLAEINHECALVLSNMKITIDDLHHIFQLIAAKTCFFSLTLSNIQIGFPLEIDKEPEDTQSADYDVKECSDRKLMIFCKEVINLNKLSEIKVDKVNLNILNAMIESSYLQKISIKLSLKSEQDIITFYENLAKKQHLKVLHIDQEVGVKDVEVLKKISCALKGMSEIQEIALLNIIDYQNLASEKMEIYDHEINQLLMVLFQHTSMRKIHIATLKLQLANAKFLSELLQNNATLLELNLAGCALDNAMIETISKGLSLNSTLQILNLSANFFDSMGLHSFCQALGNSKVSAVTEVHLSAMPTFSTALEFAKELAEFIKSGRCRWKKLYLENLKFDQLTKKNFIMIFDALANNSFIEFISFANTDLSEVEYEDIQVSAGKLRPNIIFDFTNTQLKDYVKNSIDLLQGEEWVDTSTKKNKTKEKSVNTANKAPLTQFFTAPAMVDMPKPNIVEAINPNKQELIPPLNIVEKDTQAAIEPSIKHSGKIANYIPAVTIETSSKQNIPRSNLNANSKVFIPTKSKPTVALVNSLNFSDAELSSFKEYETDNEPQEVINNIARVVKNILNYL